ncbi:MAG TPA: peroxiredoxin [Reyranella sp.]|nr:peroxiredoxin [Reyranella sp.]
MIRTFTAAVLLASIFAAPSFAALKPGDAAPDFTVPATLGGNEFIFSLADALKKGPVVLYFFPKAFTKGCTAEANAFAEATAQFTAAGATLVGMSADDIGTLQKFSTQECSSKFPVAADPSLKVIKAFDAVMENRNISDRVSYVIGQDGKVVYAYADRNPDKHVENTLTAVKALPKK